LGLDFFSYVAEAVVIWFFFGLLRRTIFVATIFIFAIRATVVVVRVTVVIGIVICSIGQAEIVETVATVVAIVTAVAMAPVEAAVRALTTADARAMM
jgi:hypothetical protein